MHHGIIAHFFVAFAVIRHPVAGLIALACAGAVGYWFKRRRS